MKKLLFLLAAAILTSCSNNSILRRAAAGNPYEVLVVCDEEFWNAPAGRALEAVLDTDIPGLPQSERSFKISRVEEENFSGMFKPFRNIITVDINENLYTKTTFKYAEDPFASPQVVLTIQSPDRASFEEYVTKNSQVIVNFLTAVEMNRQIESLQKDYNIAAFDTINKMFDCEFLVPKGLTGQKKGENFLWISNYNSPVPEIESFVIYSYPYTAVENFSKESYIHTRDSVMKKNMPGGKPDQYIQTDSMFVEILETSHKDRYVQIARGLWYMENDMMGGPFVSHSMVDEINGRIIVAEAFLYAPNRKKGNMMRKLEASLYTIKLPADKKIENSLQIPEVLIEANTEE